MAAPVQAGRRMVSRAAQPPAGPAPVGGDQAEDPLNSDHNDLSLICPSPLQIVTAALGYFGLHFHEPIQITELARSLGISEACLTQSFDRIRGMTPAQALQEHRLNKLFMTLSDQPRQGLGLAIRACGLGQTAGVVALFEQTFGIDMPLFLLTCRRAAEDRQFRLQHPEAEALVLPS
jgi:AraC-like DNA-binding protein